MINPTNLLCDLIRIKSVSTDIQEVNRCVSFLRSKLEAEGLFCATETFDDGRQSLWASNVKGKRPDLLMVVHLDVVPVDSDAQFEPVIDGDTIIGRGSVDCKGNAVAAIEALREAAADAASGASIGIIFTTDEEIGGDTTRGMVERGYGASKAALVYDCGAKSNIFIAQKGIVELRLVAKGRGGHASCPWQFDNPIYTLMEALARLRAHWEAKYPHVAGQDWHNSFAPCMLSAGKAANQIPDTATATINIRFTETSIPDGIVEEVRQVTGLEVEPFAVSQCCFFPPDNPAIGILSEVISESFGGAEVKHYRMNGATDARHLVSLGVPVAIMGITGTGSHQSDEHASLSSIGRFGHIAAEFACRLARKHSAIASRAVGLFCCLALALSGCAATDAPAPVRPMTAPPPSALCEPQEVQTPETDLPPLEGLMWRLPGKYATLDGDRLVIDIPAEDYPANAVAEAELPLPLFEGATGFSISAVAEGTALAKPTQSYLGLKFQFHMHQESTGRDWWPNCANEIGDFGPKTLRNDIAFGGMEPDGTVSVTLMLGLQGTSGRVTFDLSTLRGGPSEGLFRRINQDWVVRYPNSAAASAGGSGGAATRPFRGTMLPGRATTEDDIETLHQWGATLARFQITRNWHATDDNQDLDEYGRWVDSRLDNLEDVIRWARERGMKIAVDLHALPGGRGKGREMNMFRDKRYADAFVDTWRRIATRFKGNADVIYGYDLVNEPVQLGRAPFDYWTLQRRAAEAIREIDPDTAIIVESNGWDAAGTFGYLSPLRMDNVIYQVHVYAPTEFTHQGVHANPVGPKWPDPAKKWTQDFIRNLVEPVREFQARHRCRIYVGEFSAAAWADGAENYLRDCISLFEEYGWDWTYHAFREAPVWDVDKELPDSPAGRPYSELNRGMRPAATETPRKKALLEGFRR